MRSSERFSEQSSEKKTTVGDKPVLLAAVSGGLPGSPSSRGQVSSPKAERQNLNGINSARELGGAARGIKPRTSRWADEVDEDDHFLPSQSKVPSPKKEPAVGRSVAPRTAPSYPTRRAPAPIQQRLAEPRSKGGFNKRQERRVAVDVAGSTRQSASVDLAEISHMKETMAKKAEEKKKLKEEEEARIEAERRMRCQAKLREIEERQRTRSNSILDEKSQKVEPSNRAPPSVLPQSVDSVSFVDDAEKKEAFNSKRRDLRVMRDADRNLSEKQETIPPVSPSPAAHLSPHAQEFFPSSSSGLHMPPPPPHMMQMQWQHHMPPPHMMHPGMQMGHHQMPPPPFGYPPPQFHPYGYPPHGMAPPPNQYY